jgi:uncharacterized pyridoxal phosphate-containing UPF0001 family protein
LLAGKTMPVLIQVKLSEEKTKSGIPEADLTSLAALAESLNHLELRGLMVIPPFLPDSEGTRPYFKRLRLMRDRLQQGGFARVRELSMGMSHDFTVAIEEGATIVRIGSAIFGPRSARA